MTDRRGPLIALSLWTGVLVVGSAAATWAGVAITRITMAGFTDDGSDPGAREAFVNLIVVSEAQRALTPALAMAAAVSVAVLIALLARRWQRREATVQAEATAAS